MYSEVMKGTIDMPILMYAESVSKSAMTISSMTVSICMPISALNSLDMIVLENPARGIISSISSRSICSVIAVMKTSIEAR